MQNKRQEILWPASLTVPFKKNLDVINLQSVFKSILIEESIPESSAIFKQFNSLYFPMSCWLNHKAGTEPLIVGLNGAQGSGKSTTAKILKNLLEKGFGKHVLVLSIDDLYLTRQQRQKLSKDIHPLLAIRGVPGTHDIDLGLSILKRLKGKVFEPFKVPVFNKAIDDRTEESLWINVNEPVDIVLLEGWCVGAIAQNKSELKRSINLLEENEDKDLKWRTYVNEQLADKYKELFSLIDILIMLKVPSMEKVFEWRLLQEEKLQKTLSDDRMKPGIMSEVELKRFIMHYERITRSTLKEMPNRADVVMQIDDNQQVCRIHS